MSRFFAAWILVVALAFTAHVVSRQTANAAAPINVPTNVDSGPPIERSSAIIDAKSEQVLKKMSAYYAGLDSFSVTMQSITTVEGAGNRGEVGTSHEVLFKRPNKLAVTLKSGIMGGTIVSNGTDSILYTSMVNRYIKSASPAQASDLFESKDVALVAPGGGKLGLLDVILAKDPMEHLRKDLLGAQYIGVEKLDSAEVEHLKLSRKDATVSAWIATGDKPILKQVSVDLSESLKSPEARRTLSDAIDLRNSKAGSTFRYTDFTPNVTISDDKLTFRPPDEAQQSSSVMDMITGTLMNPQPKESEAPKISPEEAEKIAAAARTPAAQAQALKALKEMSNFYSGLQHWTTRLISTNRIQTRGIRSELATSYDMSFERPNKLSVMLKTGVNGGTAIADGTNFTLYHPMFNKYIVKKAPQSTSELFSDADFQLTTAGGFQMFLLDALLSADPYKTLTDGLGGVEYYGIEKVNDTDAHHVKLLQKSSGIDLWISSGKEPWLLRVIPDLKKLLSSERGGAISRLQDLNIDLTAVYKNMQAAAPPADAFKFTPPPDAKLVTSFIPSGASRPPHPLVNKPAPDTTLNLMDGKVVRLNDLKGKKIVVLDFWASWCGPCVRALPILTSVTGNYKNKDVSFFAVNLRESPEDIKDFLKSKGISPTVVLDKEGKIGSLFQARAIPQTVIIGKDGLIKHIHVGYHADLREMLTKELDALSGKPAPSASAK